MKTKSLPGGHVSEYVATLTEDEKQRTAVKYGRRLGENATVRTWNHRKPMAVAIRMQERHSPRSEWSPVVKLGDGEGF